MHSQLEIDTIVYPTIRGVFSLTTREARFNVAASLTLKEGPINIEGQLDLLVNLFVQTSIESST